MSAATILIVDDEPRNCDLIEAILRPAGYQLARAVDGRGALEQTLLLKPDLILLDVMMPDMTGYEVCEIIREDPDLAEIPVIMVTALDDRESRIRGLEAGADDFLTKPVDSLDLKARVKTVARLNRYRRLTAEREKFSKIADFASDALLLLKSDNTITYANSRAAQILVGGGHLAGKCFLEVSERSFVRQPPEAWDHWMESAQPDERVLRYLVRPRSEKGPSLWLQTQLFPLPATGEAAWLVRLQDVTGLMEQKRDLWNFHSMLSHKMRTPLNGLVGSLTVLSEPAGMSLEDVADLASDAMTSAERLATQVTEVLRYLDAPKISHEGDRLAGDSLRQKAGDLAERLKLEQIEIQVADDLSGRMFALSDRAMDVVLSELFDNARKFNTSGDPNIVLSAKLNDGGACELEVSNVGSSVNPDDIQHLGTPYFQGESNITGEVPGMGLGLATISTMLWEVGGSFQLANRGSGVVATLVIPGI